LLRTAPPDTVDHVDWDTITFKLNGKHRWPTYGTVHLANPLRFTKAHTEAVFRSAETFDDVLDILGAGTGREPVSRDSVSAGSALVGPVQPNTGKE